MQKKRLSSNNLIDKLHRGAVITCVGVTIYGTFLLGMRFYRYYTVIKPEREAAELQQLIKEGAHEKIKELKY